MDRPQYEHLQADITGHTFCNSISDLHLANVRHRHDYDIESGLHRQVLQVLSAGTIPERVEVHAKWPADWWQAVRERWMPKWWLRRHPVQYRRIDVDRTIYTRICPHMKFPDNRRHVEFLFKRGDDAE